MGDVRRALLALQPAIEPSLEPAPEPPGSVVEPVPQGPDVTPIRRRAGSSRRRRQREVEPRPYRLTPRFSEEELHLVTVAAAVARLTPTGWLAKTAVDVAAGIVRPSPSGFAGAVGELVEARRQVQRFSVLVNQAVAKWHATEQLPPELLSAVALVGRVLPRLEDAAVAVRQAGDGRSGRGRSGVSG